MIIPEVLFAMNAWNVVIRWNVAINHLTQGGAEQVLNDQGGVDRINTLIDWIRKFRMKLLTSVPPRMFRPSVPPERSMVI